MDQKVKKIISKISAILLIICIVISGMSELLRITVNAVTDTNVSKVYISANGSDDGAGTIERPYATLKKAIEMVGENGIIYLNSDISMDVDNIITKNITITSNGTSAYKLMRKNGSEGYCLVVKDEGTLNIENVIIDGNEQMNSWHPVIRVENGTLNIKNGGVIQNNNSHSEGAISLVNSTFNMSGGEIKNNISSMLSGAIFANSTKINISGNASITNNKVTAESSAWPLTDDEKKGAHGGALYLEESSVLNISENAQISDNSCVLYGGGIFSWNSAITMTGGKISNNKALKGAGIYSEGGSTLNLSKGEISGNEAKVNNTLQDYNENIGGAGGGIMCVNSTIEISGELNILNNKAETDGGGIHALNCTFNMNGGKIDGNIANINGGGIIFGNKTIANISAGYITNNICDLTKFNFDFVNNPNAILGTMDSIGSGSEFAGGGIYLHNGCELNMNNVVITNNTNDQTAGFDVYPDKSAKGYSGNGIVMCSTANVKIYPNNGAAIYNNGDDKSFDIVLTPNSYINDYNFNKKIDEKTIPSFYNSNFALGGGFYGWTDFSGKSVLTGDYDKTERIALKAHLSDEDIKLANEQAKVFITGNTSRGIFGAGGIACNGVLTIGTEDNATLKVEKHAEEKALLVTNKVSFDVELKGNDIDKKCNFVYFHSANGDSVNKLTWTKEETGIYKTTITLELNSEGDGYFYLLNIPDGTDFTIKENLIDPYFKTKINVINGTAEIEGEAVKGKITINRKLSKEYKIVEDSLFNVPTDVYIMYNNNYQPTNNSDPGENNTISDKPAFPKAGNGNVFIIISLVVILGFSIGYFIKWRKNSDV